MAQFEYEPSEEAKTIATSHRIMQGAFPRTWFEYVPDTARSDAPVVILLHGAGRDGLSLIDMWKDVAKSHGVILLAPNGIRGKWPMDSPRPKVVLDIFADLSGRHRIDSDRVYLFGHSNGASYAQVLMNRAEGPWRAAVLHAGYWSTENLVSPLDAKPIRLYLGVLDHIFTIPNARAVGQGLARAGHDVEFVKISQHTHWLYALGPDIADDSWQWLDQTVARAN